MPVMKSLLVLVVLVVAGLWVWNHHTATDSTFCLTAPEKVCVEHATTTTVHDRRK
jgi:hypothetical protein